MTPAEFEKVAVKIYGRKKWKVYLAEALAVDVVTIYRMMHRRQIAGPYEVAIRGLLEHRRQQIVIEKAARKLIPRKFRRKRPRSSTGRLLIRAAGDTDE